MKLRTITVAALLAMGLPAFADHFDDHDAKVLATVADSKSAQAVDKLTIPQLARLPHPLEGYPGSIFLIARTDQGHWCKLLVQYARIKKPQTDENLDLLLIERLVTYPVDPRRGLEADRTGLFFFGGFGLDLDVGQIVPEGTGEDLKLVATENGLQLQPVPKVSLYAVGRPLVKPAEVKKRQFSQGAISASDFAGEYQLQADGRWSGKVTIEVDEGGNVTGSYTSDDTGQTYELRGRTGNPTNKIAFKISFPMTEQEFEGYLWSQKRSRVSGVTHMLGRPFGFVMDRTD